MIDIFSNIYKQLERNFIMELIKEISKKHVILFSFFVAIVVDSICNGLSFGVFKLKPPIPTNNELLYITSQLISIVFVFAVAIATTNIRETGFRKKNFGKGLLLGWPFILAALLAFSSTFFASFSASGKSMVIPSPMRIIFFAIVIFLVGLQEETLFRGVILNIMLAKWKDAPKGIMLAVVLSSAVFGLSHLITLVMEPEMVVSTIAQVIASSMAGFLFCCVYLRTGNIWSNVFLHMLVDFSAMIFTLFFPQPASAASADMSVPAALAFVAIQIPYVIVGLVLLKKVGRNE
jgi:membrane protease YdiL (CAAX protease family)